MEAKLIGVYIAWWLCIALLFIGFISSQIIDAQQLAWSGNVYKALHVLWGVNHYLKQILYYSHFGVCVIEFVIEITLIILILNMLKKHLVYTHNQFKWNFIIWSILGNLSLIMHTVYVYPTSKDRYGMLEISRLGEKIFYVFIDMGSDAFTIIFWLYFVCFLRFHVIFLDLENENMLYKSLFIRNVKKSFNFRRKQTKSQNTSSCNGSSYIIKSEEFYQWIDSELNRDESSLSDPELDRKAFKILHRQGKLM